MAGGEGTKKVSFLVASLLSEAPLYALSTPACPTKPPAHKSQREVHQAKASGGRSCGGGGGGWWGGWWGLEVGGVGAGERTTKTNVHQSTRGLEDSQCGTCDETRVIWNDFKDG